MWQPIETAPKDGTPFLALCGWSVSTWRIVERPEKRTTRKVGAWPFYREVEDVEEAALILENVLDGGTVTNVLHGRFGMPPTHWMPMPKRPK